MRHKTHSANRQSRTRAQRAFPVIAALLGLQAMGCRAPAWVALDAPGQVADTIAANTIASAAGNDAGASATASSAINQWPSGIRKVSHLDSPLAPPPPRVRDFDNLPRRTMSLDEAIRLALETSPVIGGLGGRVLAMPDTVRTTLDSAILQSDPHLGSAAALSAFDTQFESGIVWNGGGRSLNSSFTSGQFGVFAQPRTLAKIGVGRVLGSGTQATLGIVGGYDSNLAGGLYAAYGGEVRHPLMRGSGRQFNQIAGPMAKPGVYRGILIAKIEQQKGQLDLEQAVQDQIRDVSLTYWELYFAYQNLNTKQTAMENARQSWELEKTRVAGRIAPVDSEALARQQYHTAKADVVEAISGTPRGVTGVYDVELQLRNLLGLPASDGTLIVPDASPLKAEFHFDWDETILLANTHRIELRRQQHVIQQRRLEIKAAKNQQRAQLDLTGAYRRLADDPAGQSDVFNEALDGWQVGLEYRRAVSNRRENAAVRNALLHLQRGRALLDQQRQHVAAQVRTAFTELDRAFSVMHWRQTSAAAAKIRLRAESDRHAAGDSEIQRVLEAQVRATQADTAFQRALVDYNLAFIQVNHARGTLFHTMGIGFADPTSDEIRFAQQSPSPFANPSESSGGAREMIAERDSTMR